MGRSKPLPVGPQDVTGALGDAPPLVAETIPREPSPPPYLVRPATAVTGVTRLETVKTSRVVPRSIRPTVQETLTSPIA